tara:strand:+ start:748 stop:1275 length:528 start_codon:yes stop_codon:yes gene_type:complete
MPSNSAVIRQGEEVTGPFFAGGAPASSNIFGGLTASVQATAGSITIAANTISINDFVGGAAQTSTLPAATVGARCVHLQSVDTTGGTNALTFDCAGTDAFNAGQHVQSTSGAKRVIDTSAAGETSLVFTPANATTNLFTIGCMLVFTCKIAGLWEVEQYVSTDPLSVTGTFAFAA